MKSKTSNKRAKLVAILLVLVMLISVGYAALETLLQISGTATLKKKTWNVHFANVQIKQGSVQATTAPEVPANSTDTTSLTWAVNMDTPGQYYEFNVDVVNGGTIDAMVSTATNEIVTSALTNEQKAYLDDTIKYENGAAVEQYDALPKGETRTITVKLLFKQDINPNVLPGTNQTGLTLSYNANYVQADSNVNTQKQTQMQYTVTFKDDDGTTTLKTVQVNKGGTASYGEENPTKAQDANYTYEFSKWVTEQGGNTEATLTNITEAKTVYASYTATAIPVALPAIGSTVNYSTTLNGQTLNNWKVFYNDEANGYTYIILDDYLPNSAVPAFTGKQTNGTYVVNTNTNRDDLINGLGTKSNWSSLLTGTLNGTTPIDYSSSQDENIYAMGAPTLELWVNSWNTSYPSDTLYTNTRTGMSGEYNYGYYIGTDNAQTTSTSVNLSSKTGYSNTLYYPHTSAYNSCYGYWLASPSASYDYRVMNVSYYGHVSNYGCSNLSYAARPVVCLPSNILQ